MVCQRFPDLKQTVSLMKGNLQKHHLSRSGGRSGAGSGGERSFSVCVTCRNSPGLSGGPSLPVATLAPLGIKPTWRNVQRKLFERDLGVFQTLSLQRKICRLFFLKKNKPLEMNFERDHLCRESSQKGKRNSLKAI